MPISPPTISDLTTTTAHLDFLLAFPTPYLYFHSPDAYLCTICQSSFDDDTRVTQPVQLYCGHTFDLKCLARLVFAPEFDNCCPRCRVSMIPETYLQSPIGLSWGAVVPLQTVLMMFSGDKGRFERRTMLEALRRWVEREVVTRRHVCRVMVVYEEFVNRVCGDEGGEEEVGDAEGEGVAEGLVRGLVELIDQAMEVTGQRFVLMRIRAEQERERESSDLKGKLEEAKRRLEETRVRLERSRRQSEDTARELRDVKGELEVTRVKLKRWKRHFEDFARETWKIDGRFVVFMALALILCPFWAIFRRMSDLCDAYSYMTGAENSINRR